MQREWEAMSQGSKSMSGSQSTPRPTSVNEMLWDTATPVCLSNCLWLLWEQVGWL